MSDEQIGFVEIKLNLGGNEYTLGIRHFHIVDVVSGGELPPAQLGKAIRAALQSATGQLQENVELWGYEGIILEATGRVERKEKS